MYFYPSPTNTLTPARHPPKIKVQFALIKIFCYFLYDFFPYHNGWFNAYWNGSKKEPEGWREDKNRKERGELDKGESGQIAKLDFAIPKDKYLVMLFCVVQMKSSKGFEQTGYMLNIHVLMLMHLDQKAELQNTIQNWSTFNVDVVTTNLFGFPVICKLEAMNPKFASRDRHVNISAKWTLIVW